MNGQFFCETSDECVPCSGVVELRAENERLKSPPFVSTQYLADQQKRIAKLEQQLEQYRWHRVADGMPTMHGRYAVKSVTLGASACTEYDGTNYWSEDAYWLGPLPEAGTD